MLSPTAALRLQRLPGMGAPGAPRFHRIATTPDLHLSPEGLAALGELSAESLLRLADFEPGTVPVGDCRTVEAIVAAWQAPLSAEFLARFPRLRMIALRATSRQKVALDYTQAHGIPVANIEGYGDIGTTEFVVQQLLRIARDVPFEQGGHPTELRGKTLGLVGFGSVAQQVAAVAAALGMEVHFTVPDPRGKERPATASYKPLPALLSESDFISFHSPAFSQVVDGRDLKAIGRNAGVIVTTLGLPFAFDDFARWISAARNPVAFDLCAAHEHAEALRQFPSVTVWNAYSARTPESIARAEGMVLGNLRRFLGDCEAAAAGSAAGHRTANAS